MNKTFVIVLTLILASTCVYAGPKGKNVVKAVKAATTNPAALSRMVTRPVPIVEAKITARQVLVPPQPVTQVAPRPRVLGLDPKNMGPRFSALRSEISGVPSVIDPQLSTAVEAAVTRASIASAAANSEVPATDETKLSAEDLEKELENLARQHGIDPYSLGDLGEVKPSPELQQEIRAYKIRMAMKKADPKLSAEDLEKELENLARQYGIDPYSLGDLGEVKPSPELQQEIRAYRIRMATTGGSRPNLTEAEKKVESEAVGSAETINQEK